MCEEHSECPILSGLTLGLPDPTTTPAAATAVAPQLQEYFSMHSRQAVAPCNIGWIKSKNKERREGPRMDDGMNGQQHWHYHSHTLNFIMKPDTRSRQKPILSLAQAHKIQFGSACAQPVSPQSLPFSPIQSNGIWWSAKVFTSDEGDRTTLTSSIHKCIDKGKRKQAKLVLFQRKDTSKWHNQKGT